MNNKILTSITLALIALTIFSCSKEDIQITENETTLKLLRVISPSEYPLNLVSDEELRAFDAALIWEDDQLVSGSFEPLAETLNERQLDQLMKAIYGQDVQGFDESTDESSYRGGGSHWLKNFEKVGTGCIHHNNHWCFYFAGGPHK